MANYAIGDIQGCFESFQYLLDQIQFNPEKDKLWLAGDLVNRGPSSLATLRYVYELGEACETVLGNHDLHLLAVYHGCAKIRNKDTLTDILEAPDAKQLLAWLQQQSLIKEITLDTKSFLLSHAGIPPIWNKNQALAYAKEVEDYLQSDYALDFFQNMYGNTPACWQDSLQGMERLRVITNYFTRMRFCNEQGSLELLCKNSPNQAPEGYQPWFKISNPALNKEKLLFGHWAALKGKTNTANCFALDTGCVWGNSLSALRLEDEKSFSCEC